MDLGQNHRGVEMGPAAIRYADLAKALTGQGYHVHDVGNLDVPQRYGLDREDPMEIIAESGKCNSLDVVEVNPILDLGNKTAQVAVQLAASLAGKTIL